LRPLILFGGTNPDPENKMSVNPTGIYCRHDHPNCAICSKGRDFQVCAKEKDDKLYITYHETRESADTSYDHAAKNTRFDLVQLRQREGDKWVNKVSNKLTRNMIEGRD
jgi:hypothetical protein